IAQCMPPAAHAVAAESGPARAAWAQEALLRAFLDDAVDALVREAWSRAPAAGGVERGPAPRAEVSRSGAERDAPAGEADARSWEKRWLDALSGERAELRALGFAERTLLEDLERWSEPLVGARDRLRACFRLELPEDADQRHPLRGRDGRFTLRFLLQSPEDPSLLVGADEVWRAGGGR